MITQPSQNDVKGENIGLYDPITGYATENNSKKDKEARKAAGVVAHNAATVKYRELRATLGCWFNGGFTPRHQGAAHKNGGFRGGYCPTCGQFVPMKATVWQGEARGEGAGEAAGED